MNLCIACRPAQNTPRQATGNVELGPDRHGITQLWSGGGRKTSAFDARALDVGEVLPFPPGPRPHPKLQYRILISFAPDPGQNLDDSTELTGASLCPVVKQKQKQCIDLRLSPVERSPRCSRAWCVSRTPPVKYLGGREPIDYCFFSTRTFLAGGDAGVACTTFGCGPDFPS